MKSSFLKRTVIILSLLIGGSGVLFASNKSQSTFLFALRDNINLLNISRLDNVLSVDNLTIQDFIESYEIENIEPWLMGANEKDHDGNLYLNRIYRVYIGENRSDIDFLISISFFSFSFLFL